MAGILYGDGCSKRGKAAIPASDHKQVKLRMRLRPALLLRLENSSVRTGCKIVAAAIKVVETAPTKAES